MSDEMIDKEMAKKLMLNVVKQYHSATGKIPQVLFVVGGTAMAFHNMREQSEDVDLFFKDLDFEYAVKQVEEETEYRIDVTSEKNLWGDLVIPDIEKDAKVTDFFVFEGHDVQIAAISPETLAVIKASSMREKDRLDIPLILKKTTPEEILARFACLWTSQRPSVAKEALINIVGEIQLALREPVSPEWFQKVPTEIQKKWANSLKENFGMSLSQKENDHGRTI